MLIGRGIDENMTKEVYDKLVNERNELVKSLDKAVLTRHITPLQQQLEEVRKKIKDAHREQYKRAK